MNIGEELPGALQRRPTPPPFDVKRSPKNELSSKWPCQRARISTRPAHDRYGDFTFRRLDERYPD